MRRYQHASADRDRVIAEALSQLAATRQRDADPAHDHDQETEGGHRINRRPPRSAGTPHEGLDPHLSKQEETVESTVPSGHHTWAELLRLVDAVRRIAHDRTIEPDDALRRIRDAYQDYDEGASS